MWNAPARLNPARMNLSGWRSDGDCGILLALMSASAFIISAVTDVGASRGKSETCVYYAPQVTLRLRLAGMGGKGNESPLRSDSRQPFYFFYLAEKLLLLCFYSASTSVLFRFYLFCFILYFGVCLLG